MTENEYIITSSYTKNYNLNLLTSHAFHKELLVNTNFAMLDSIMHNQNRFLSRSVAEPASDSKDGDCVT